MSCVNWKVRISNKNFWCALIPAILILIQVLGSIIGLEINLDEMGTKLLNLVNAVFMVLAILGIVQDPTTKGIGDSALAMTYTSINKNNTTTTTSSSTSTTTTTTTNSTTDENNS